MADFPLHPDTDSAAQAPSHLLRQWALEAGFSDAGVIPLPWMGAERDGQRFADWIDKNRHGSMEYLARTNELGELLRQRVETPFPWARSALVCWSSYHFAGPRSIHPAPPETGWIARYAWSSRNDPQRGRQASDYHKVLLKRLREVEAKASAQYEDVQLRSFVDTGPVVERSLAVAAGLGWRGKNTCLIHTKQGSFGFLAVMLTSLELTAQQASAAQVHPDRCGSCTRCIEACPTNALTAPYFMDATRCIAYLTIEHKGAIAEELMDATGRQVFGCDICQEVCPWNRKAVLVEDAEMQPRAELMNPALEMLAELEEADFERLFNGSPVRRAGFNGLRRNVAIAMGNSGLRRFQPILEGWAQSMDEGLSTAARRALKKLP